MPDKHCQPSCARVGNSATRVAWLSDVSARARYNPLQDGGPLAKTVHTLLWGIIVQTLCLEYVKNFFTPVGDSRHGHRLTVLLIFLKATYAHYQK